MDDKRGVAHYSQINAGARLFGICSQRARSVLAGSGSAETQDNFWHLGKVIDRLTPGLFLSAQNVLTVHPTLNGGENVTIERRYRHDSDPVGAFAADLPAHPVAEFPLVTVLAAEVAAGTPFSYRDNLDLAGAKQYVRCDVRLNLSRANTDTALMAAVMTLAGTDSDPVS